MKLNLGCGRNKMPGYLNVDKYAAAQPDQIVDLEQLPWPFETSSAEEIVLNHVLEHLGESRELFLGIIKELWRVAAPDALIHIVVPHPRHDNFTGDPTHVRPITPHMLSLLSRRLNEEWAEGGYSNTPLALYLGVNFEIIEMHEVLDPDWQQRHDSGQITDEFLRTAISGFNNVVAEYRILLQALKD